MNKNIILQHYYYSRKKIISKRWCPGLIDERNIGKCLHSSSVGAHSLNLIVQYELIQLLKYWWVTSLKTLPWILWCVRTVRRLRVTQTCTWAELEHWWGLHTLRWQQGERFRSSSAQESLISKIFHNRTVFSLHAQRRVTLQLLNTELLHTGFHVTAWISWAAVTVSTSLAFKHQLGKLLTTDLCLIS